MKALHNGRRPGIAERRSRRVKWRRRGGRKPQRLHLEWLEERQLLSADLQIMEVRVPQGPPSTAEPFEVSWTTRNVGDQPATTTQLSGCSGFFDQPGWRNSVHLSADEILDSSDIALWSGACKNNLAAGAEYEVSVPVLAGSAGPGRWFVLVTADSGNRLNEGDGEENNTRAVPVLFRAPDLAVQEFTAPAVVSAGDKLTARWTVANMGDGNAGRGTSVRMGSSSGFCDPSYRVRYWIDSLYLSADSTLSPDDIALKDPNRQWASCDFPADQFVHTGTLAPGESYARSGAIAVPDVPSGDWFLILHSDSGNEQSEAWRGENNIGVSPLRVVKADLAITSFAAPADVVTGQSVSLDWTVQNQGEGETFSTSARRTWRDGAYLSRDTKFSMDDVLLGDWERPAPLIAGEQYSRSMVVTIPRVTPGDWYLILKTNEPDRWSGRVYEDATESAAANNVVIRPIRIRQADLTVTGIMAPVEGIAGQPIDVSWTVTNQGTGAASGSWRDRVYLSRDSMLTFDDIEIGSGDWSDLVPGAEYKKSISPTLPRVESGDWFVVVRADQSYSITEGFNEANNFLAQPIRIVLPENVVPDPIRVAVSDLVPLGVPGEVCLTFCAPAQAVAQERISMAWTVRNGGAPTGSLAWTDRVYVSHDSIWSADDVRLMGGWTGGLPNPVSLGTGEQYTRTDVVETVPLVEPGDWFLILSTDYENSVAESETEPNNMAATPIHITLPAAPVGVPDMAVTAVESPTEIDLANIQYLPSLAWTLTNTSPVTVNRARWHYGVYLSRDTSLSGEDVRIASEMMWQWGVPFGALGPGETDTIYQPLWFSSEVQDLTIGNWYLLFKVDDTGDWYETSEENNVLASPSVRFVGALSSRSDSEPPAIGQTAESADGPVPDLIPQGRDELYPLTFTTPAHGAAGQPVTVAWTVRNLGTGNTDTGWRDQVFLSRDDVLTPDDTPLIDNNGHFRQGLPLAPGRQSTQYARVTLPRVDPGDWYLILHTNNEGSIFEGTGHSNNMAVRPFRVVVPDLSVVQPAEPTVAIAGQSFEWSWTVTNEGPAAAPATWSVTTYLSRDTIWSHDDLALDTWSPAGDAPALDTTERVSQVREAKMPDLAPGQWYMLVVADLGNSLYEAAAEANNVAVRSLTVRVPDLNVEILIAPDVVTIGGKFDATWRVRNSGTGDITYEWTTPKNNIYLSRDGVIDNEDIRLGGPDRTGPLAAGAAYDQSSTFAVPRLPGGRWNLILRVEPSSLWENQETANNVFARPIVLADPDLVVQSVEVPSGAAPGRSTLFSWTVVNQGAATAQGSWQDALYLSSDRTLDTSDHWLGNVNREDPLAGSASYTAFASFDFPPLMPGDYYLIVRTDSRYRIAEGDGELNNIHAGPESFTVLIPQVPLGGTTNDRFSAPGQSHYFSVVVPPGQSLLVRLDSDAPSGLNELFIRRDALPTPGDFDARSPIVLAPDQEASLSSSAGGTYYILARTRFGVTSSASYSISASVPVFGIRQVTPGTVKSAGPTTLTIRGSEFAADAIVELVSPAGPVYPITQHYVDASTIEATFDFSGFSTGVYDVRVAQAGSEPAILGDAVEVAVGVGGRIEASVSVPQTARRDRLTPALISLVNTGDADASAPLLLIFTSQTVSIGLEPHQLVAANFMAVFGAGGAESAGIIRPGHDVRIPLYFRSGTTGEVEFTVLPVLTTDTTAFDPGALEEWFQAVELPAEEREPVWARLREQFGSTWGSFVQVLARNARVLPPELGDPRRVSDLLAPELWRARAAVGTSLTGSIQAVGTWSDFGGLVVQARNTDTGEDFSTRLLRDGSFVFSRLTPGDYELSIDDVTILSDPHVRLIHDDAVNGFLVVVRERQVSLSGSVRAAENGEAVAMARVMVRSLGAPIATTETDEHGRFAVRGLPPGVLEVEISAPGRVPAHFQNVTVRVLDFELQPEGVIRGRIERPEVVAPDVEPFVHIHRVAGSWPAEAFAVSIADDRFAISGLPAGSFEIIASWPGCSPARRGVDLAAGQTVDLGFLPCLAGSTVRGVITGGPLGSAAAGVDVLLVQDESLVAATTAAESGLFTFPDIPAGRYIIVVPRWTGLAPEIAVEVVSRQDPAPLTVPIAPGGVLAGTVRSSGINTPMARVSVVLAMGDRRFTTVTSDAGVYQFKGLVTGIYTVSVVGTDSTMARTVTVTATDGSELWVDLDHASAARLEGRLVSAANAPLATGTVWLYRDGNLVASSAVDEHGRYGFWLQEAGTFELRAASNGVSFAPHANITIQAGESKVLDLVAGSGSLVLQVTDPVRVPLYRGDLVWRFERRSVEGTALVLYQRQPHTLVRVGETVVGSDGTASFNNLAAGSYLIDASDGEQRAARLHAEISGAQPTELAVELVQQQTVTGRITDEQGLPISNAYVVLAPSDHPSDETYRASTLENGAFVFSAVKPGSYDLIISADGHEPVVQANRISLSITSAGDATAAEAINVALRRSTAELVNRVVDASGQPVAGATVRVRDSLGRTLGEATSLADGSFRVPVPPGSTVTYEVAAAGLQSARATYSVPAATGGARASANAGAGTVSLEQGGVGQAAPVADPVVDFLVANRFLTPETARALLDLAGRTSSFRLRMPNPSAHVTEDQVLSIAKQAKPDRVIACQRMRLALSNFYIPRQSDRYNDIGWRQLLWMGTNFAQLPAVFAAETAAAIGNVANLVLSLTPVGAVSVGFKLPRLVGTLLPVVERYMHLLPKAQARAIALLQNVQDVGLKIDILKLKNLLDIALGSYKGLWDTVQQLATDSSAQPPEGRLTAILRRTFSATQSTFDLFGMLIRNPVLKESFDGVFGKTGLGIGAINFVVDLLAAFKSGGASVWGNSLELVTEMVRQYEAYEGTIRNYREWVGTTWARYHEYYFCLYPPNTVSQVVVLSGDIGRGSASARFSSAAQARRLVAADQTQARGVSNCVGSNDPNDLVGPAGFGEQRAVAGTKTLGYTIRFENDPKEATAPAQEVLVTHKLDDDLDWRSFELGIIEFGAIHIDVPAGSDFFQTSVDTTNPDASPLRVNIDAEIDLARGLVTWHFQSIDPATGELPEDPMAGFLPVNDATGAGEGFVTYTVRPKPDIENGARIDAAASIIFDTNDPVATPPIFNTIDIAAPSSVVAPLPARTNSRSFTVNWSGDDYGGAGVESFDVFVSIDGGAFEPWLIATTDTSATYSGEFDHTYSFYSIATDRLGHRQASAAAARALTRTFELPVIRGTVRQDLTGNGDSPDDTALANWTIVLFRDDGDGVLEPASGDAVVGVQQTDAAGGFAFLNLQPGRYFVRPDVRLDWRRTVGPESVRVEASGLASGESYATDFSFLRVGTQSGSDATVSGRVREDRLGDGFGEGDVPLAGWAVALFADDDDGTFENSADTLLSIQATDDSGAYHFNGLAAGSYFVHLQVPPGWLRTTGVSEHAITLAASENLSGRNFTVAQSVTLTGSSYEDRNGNRLRDDGEPGLPGRTVFIDADENGLLDAGELRTDTDADGNYSFAGLKPGGYTVRQLPSTGWQQTAPSQLNGWSIVRDGSFETTLGPDLQLTDEDTDSTKRQRPLSFGFPFGDWHSNEVTVTDNGFITLGRWDDRSCCEGRVDELGDRLAPFWIDLDPGRGGSVHFNDLGDRAVITWNRVVSYEGQNDPNTFQVQLFADGEIVFSYKGITLPHRFVNEWSRNLLVGLAPWDGWDPVQPPAEVDFSAHRVINTDSVAVYELIHADQGERWDLDNVSLRFIPITQSAPNEIFALSGATVTELDFGQARGAIITGQVFSDTNANGTKDAAELGIAGRTVYLDDNDNGQFDPSERISSTDASGTYWFTELKPGGQIVRQVLPLGSILTAPRDGSTVVIGRFGQTGRVDFGNAVDRTPPEWLGLPDDLDWYSEDHTSTDAIIRFSPRVLDAIDSEPTVTCTPPSGSRFSLGDTTVLCTATDDSGNASTVQLVFVVEPDDPLIGPRDGTVDVFRVISRVNSGPLDLRSPDFTSRPGDMTVAATGPAGAIVTFPLPTVQDDVDPSPLVACSPASGSLFPIGTTTVECSATDDAGLTSRLWFDVTVVDLDITPPALIDVPADFSIEARRRTGAIVTYQVPSASDVADATPTVMCSPASGTVFPIGTRTVTCTATDDAGNFNSATFRVTVTLRDSTAPTVERVDLGGTTAISRLSVTFSEPMDPAEAQKLANYRMVAAGRDLRFGTPDDRAVALHSVWFDDATRTTHVYLAQSPRSNQLVRLIVGASSLIDLAGNVLDGNADGNAGDAFSTIVGLGTRLSLLDADGDVVSFRLTGPGTMQLRLSETGTSESLRLINTTVASLLSGSIRRARSGGDGRFTLPQLTLSPGAEFRSRLTRPLFRIGPLPSDEVDNLLTASGGTLADILLQV